MGNDVVLAVKRIAHPYVGPFDTPGPKDFAIVATPGDRRRLDLYKKWAMDRPVTSGDMVVFDS